MSVSKTGDWGKVDKMFADIGQRFQKNVQAATGLNGRLLETTIVTHFQRQDLGWKTLTPRYRARKLREGTSEKILIRTSTLMQNINYQRTDWRSGFVGVLRNVTTKDGESLVNIAAVHEFGTRDGRVPARPFFAPSQAECEQQMVRNYQDAVDKTFKP